MIENKVSGLKYYNEIVKPTVDEFMSDKTNIRRGFLAAITINHIKDYLYDDYSVNNQKRTIDIHLHNECNALSIIQDTCNAAKHNKLTRGTPSIISSKQVIQNDVPSLFKSPFGIGGFLEASEVFIKFTEEKNGVQFILLSQIIRESIEYWDNKLLN